MKAWRRGAVGAACALVGMLGLAGQAGAHLAAWLVATPAAAPAGATITVEGGSFGTGEVALRWDSAAGPVLAVAQGPDFSVKVTVPQSSAGSHDVVAVQGDFERSAQVKVKGTPAAAPATATPAGEPQRETTAPAPTAEPATATEEAQPSAAQPAPAQPAPAQPALAEPVPAKTAPAKTAPAKTAPAKTAPVETAPTKAPVDLAPAAPALAEPADPGLVTPAPVAMAPAAPASGLAPTPAALEFRSAPSRPAEASPVASREGGEGDAARLLERNEGPGVAGGVIVLGLGLALLASGFTVAAVRRHRPVAVPTTR